MRLVSEQGEDLLCCRRGYATPQKKDRDVLCGNCGEEGGGVGSEDNGLS